MTIPVTSSSTQHRPVRQQRGVSALAYGLVVGLISVVALGAISSGGTGVNRLFGTVATRLQGAAPAATVAPTATATPTVSDVVWQSSSNSAQMRAYLYTGPNTTLTWTVQHNACQVYGKITPGSNSSAHLNLYCAYSPSQNHVVTSQCNWSSQTFTRVSGTLPAGAVAWACTHANCDHQQRVEGTSITAPTGATVTIRTNDYVFCSP